MQTPLLVSSFIRHAALNHADTEIVSRDAAGTIHRYTYADAYARAHASSRMLSQALE